MFHLSPPDVYQKSNHRDGRWERREEGGVGMKTSSAAHKSEAPASPSISLQPLSEPTSLTMPVPATLNFAFDSNAPAYISAPASPIDDSRKRQQRSSGCALPHPLPSQRTHRPPHFILSRRRTSPSQPLNPPPPRNQPPLRRPSLSHARTFPRIVGPRISP